MEAALRYPAVARTDDSYSSGEPYRLTGRPSAAARHSQYTPSTSCSLTVVDPNDPSGSGANCAGHASSSRWRSAEGLIEGVLHAEVVNTSAVAVNRHFAGEGFSGLPDRDIFHPYGLYGLHRSRCGRFSGLLGGFLDSQRLTIPAPVCGLPASPQASTGQYQGAGSG